MDFLTEQMDEHNLVANGPDLKKKFNALLQKTTGEVYTDGYINKCFVSLNKGDLIFKRKQRGMYQVNPLYFYRGSSEDRMKAIRKNLEEENITEINNKRREIILQRKPS